MRNLPGAVAVPSAARRLWAPLGTLTGAAAAFAFVGAVDPGVPGRYPVCPLLQVTGLYCPGCGGLRAAHAVVHGDLAAAAASNALAVAGFALFAVLLAVWFYRAASGTGPAPRPRPVLWWALAALALAFTLVRNLPFGAALAP